MLDARVLLLDLADRLDEFEVPLVPFGAWSVHGVWNPKGVFPAPPLSKVKGIVYHHSASRGVTDDALQAVRSVERGVFGRRKSDSSHVFGMVAYSWLIAADGVVYEGRGFGYGNGANGCRKSRVWSNKNTFSVCFPGYFHTPVGDVLTREQVRSARVLRDCLGDMAGRGLEAFPHSDVDATACPGDNVRARARDLATAFRNSDEWKAEQNRAVIEKVTTDAARSMRDGARVVADAEAMLKKTAQFAATVSAHVRRVDGGEVSMEELVLGDKAERVAAAVVLNLSDGSDPFGAATRADVMTMCARAVVHARRG